MKPVVSCVIVKAPQTAVVPYRTAAILRKNPKGGSIIRERTAGMAQRAPGIQRHGTHRRAPLIPDGLRGSSVVDGLWKEDYMRTLDQWDWEYVDEIVTLNESVEIEKKAGQAFKVNASGKVSSETLDEIAKQVCAFSNAAGGFLVFGIDKSGRVDGGVPRLIGRTTTKDWVEAIIPKQLHKPVYECEAEFIEKPGWHEPDLGTLVISIPLSERRPHWVVQNGIDLPYIRAGAHSAPMSLQTFLDMHSRTDAPQGEVVTLGKSQKTIHHDLQWEKCTIRPRVRLTAGPLAERWGLELRVSHNTGTFWEPENEKVTISEGSHVVFFEGRQRLYPGRPTIVGSCRFTLSTTDEALQSDILATLYVESAPPQEFRFPAKVFHETENEQNDT